MPTKTLSMIMLALCSASTTISLVQAAPFSEGLAPKATIEVSTESKRFDLMAVDSVRHRLLAAHSQAGTLTVVNLDGNKLEGEIPVGKSSGVAVDTNDSRYFVGTTRGVAVVDSITLKKTDFIATPGPTDAMVFDADNNSLYVGHDDGKELWIIDARHDKLTGRIAIPGAPELMAIDPQSHRLYLNIKPLNEVVAIDPATGKSVAHWSTLPTESPHGLVLDLHDRRLYVVGHSHMVSVFSLPTGTQERGIDIGPGRVDQAAFDPGADRLYCPSGGRLVIVKISSRSNRVVGSVAIPKGTHSVAVDPNTHWVWIAYADKNHSYVQGFSPEVASQATRFKGRELEGDARISMNDAQAIALKAYPGTITDKELEREDGGSGLRYSFDIARHQITHEVGVDAETGKVLENDQEGTHPD